MAAAVWLDHENVQRLKTSVDALDHEELSSQIVLMESWGPTNEKELAVWAKMQSTRKGKFAWNKQKRVPVEGDEEEEEEVEEEEEEGEGVDFNDEEWQGATTEEIFVERMPHKFTVARIVKLGIYEGERAPRPPPTEVPFDAMVTARSGFGLSLAPNGEVYVGYWQGNVRSGKGAQLMARDGGLFVGNWSAGKRHGHGKMVYADGSTYEGEWAFGKRHGKGTFTYVNGDRYVGQFFNGAKEGDGVYRAMAAETKFEAEFLKGQLLAGKATTADGSAYYGTFKKGAADGKGAWALSNSVVAAGVFTGVLPEDADPEDESARLVYTWVGKGLSTAGTATDQVLRATLCVSKKPLKIVISGPPAGGKGTQCEHIKAQTGVWHISTGDLLRAAAADESNELGQKAKARMEAGELVPDELICALLKTELERPEAQANGWLLDGFPRTGGQVRAMEEMFIVPNKVIVLQVPDDVLLQRVLGRRMDPETNKIYHMELNPVPDDADKEAIEARLVTREDDTEEKFTKRIAAFHTNEQTLLDAYPSARVLDGNRLADDISADIAVYLA